MPLSFRPEDIGKLTERFPKALEKIWVAKNNMQDRPGLHREHLFDFNTGLRLLISKDVLDGGKSGPEIHVSASWEFNHPCCLKHASEEVQGFYKIIGGKGNLRFLGFSPQMIPHWIVEEVQ